MCVSYHLLAAVYHSLKCFPPFVRPASNHDPTKPPRSVLSSVQIPGYGLLYADIMHGIVAPVPYAASGASSTGLLGTVTALVAVSVAYLMF